MRYWNHTPGLLGASSFLGGLALRLEANNINWPSSYTYSGPRSETKWAIAEQADIDVARFLMALGIVLIAVYFLKKPTRV